MKTIHSILWKNEYNKKVTNTICYNETQSDTLLAIIISRLPSAYQ